MSLVKWDYSATLSLKGRWCVSVPLRIVFVDWWESSMAEALVMQMELQLFPVPISLFSSSLFSTCSQRWRQQGVQETLPWTSQKSATHRSPNYLPVKAKTISSWPAMEVLSQLVSRTLISQQNLFNIRLWMVIRCSNKRVIFVAFPGSADSEVSEEQKKEKLAELKKKEKDLRDKLAKKLEELKKICLREAVSFIVIQLFLRDANHTGS